jgi:hypothetical protein
LGFEQDTVKSITQDIDTLTTLDLDIVQVHVLTPYPRTEQRAEIEKKFGIFEHDLTKYNSRHLVWNHPNISHREMLELQTSAHSRLMSSTRALRTLAKFSVFGGKSRPTAEGPRLILAGFSRDGRRLHQQLKQKLASARQWAREGWFAYEENKELIRDSNGGRLNPS